MLNLWCRFCNQHLKNKKRRNYSNVKHATYKCFECKDNYNLNLQIHNEKIKSGMKYLCIICSKSFAGIDSLFKHIHSRSSWYHSWTFFWQANHQVDFVHWHLHCPENEQNQIDDLLSGLVYLNSLSGLVHFRLSRWVCGASFVLYKCLRNIWMVPKPVLFLLITVIMGWLMLELRG